VDPSTFFFFSLGAFYEFTDADGSAYNHEFQIGDFLVELRRTIPWEGFVFIPAARLSFPSSKLSQAAQRYANAGLGVTVVRPIPEALGMTIAAVARYQHWFAGSNVSLAQGDCIAARPGATTGTGPEADPSYLCNAVGRNESDRIVAGMNINVTPVEHFTLTLRSSSTARAGPGGTSRSTRSLRRTISRSGSISLSPSRTRPCSRLSTTTTGASGARSTRTPSSASA
jgi:hypothetical protein